MLSKFILFKSKKLIVMSIYMYELFFLQKYQVSFSMLEIYNEQVRDLLVKNNPKGGLQVRLNYLSDFFVC